MKKVVDFRFNNPLYAELADYLHKVIAGTPFDGHVYLVGDVITNQILKLSQKSEYLNVIVDIPNGGISFPIWLTYKNKCYKEGQNPLINANDSSSVFNIGGNSKLAKHFFVCHQSRNSFIYNETRCYDKWHGKIEEDAEKRGFTFESLYYNVSDECLYDLTEKGFDDIENKIIRASNVKTLFTENPIKLLIAIRYASAYGFGIERDTWFSIIEHAKNIIKIKPISVRLELDRILLSEKPSDGIMRIMRAGLTPYTWSFLDKMATLKTMPYDYIKETVLEHTLKVVDNVSPSLVTRLGALFHDIGKTTTSSHMYMYHQLEGVAISENFLQQMGYSTMTIEGVKTIVACHEDLSKFKGSMTPGTKFAKKLSEKTGQYLDAVLEVIDANNKAQVFGKKVKQVLNLKNVYKKIKEDEETKKLKLAKKIHLPINGDDIKKEFKLKTGIKIGQLLEIVKKEYVNNNKLTRDECFTICENALSKGF